MSLHFGQFRSSQLDEYIKPLEYTNITFKTKSKIKDNVIFLDSAIQLNENYNFQAGKHYYLSINLFGDLDYQQNFTVKFKNKNGEDIESLFITNILIHQQSGGVPEKREIIITPLKDCNTIVFELERIEADYSIKSSNGISGRIAKIEVNECQEIINILEKLQEQNTSIDFLKQVIIHSPKNLLMEINGEPIKVNKTGQYKIPINTIPITSIGFIVRNRDSYVILNYQY